MCEDDEAIARNYGRIFVVGVTLLILFVPLTTNIFIFYPWLSFHYKRNMFLWLGPFNISVLFIWINYYLGCTTPPGPVPSTFVPKETVKGRKPRWCQVCSAYKPMRTHHCRICRKCVLKMDHHCPWLNNCIGHFNHAHFIRFICSVTFGVISCLTLIGLRMWDVIRYQNHLASYYSSNTVVSASEPLLYFTPPPDFAEIIFMIANILILFVLLFTVGFLTFSQIYNASLNVTTIESYENAKIEEFRRKGKLPADKFIYPFDMGMYRNFQILFGDTMLFWWLPKTVKGDGVSWEMNQQNVEEWPPREYFFLKQNPNASFSEEDLAIKRKYGKHVRRGSEGYIIEEISHQDREKMLDDTCSQTDDQQNPLIEFDSEFDSMEDTDDNDMKSEPTKDVDSDDEILGLRNRVPFSSLK